MEVSNPKVFISYSHKDKSFLKELKAHLKPFVRNGDFEVWDDTRIQSGQDWHEEIRRGLHEACVAILLVSADFLDSDYVMTQEIPVLLDFVAKKDLKILPVIISDCSYEHTPLSKFQMINDPRKPLKKLRRAVRDSVWKALTQQVKTYITRFYQNSFQLSLGDQALSAGINKKNEIKSALLKHDDTRIIEVILGGDFDSYHTSSLKSLLHAIVNELGYRGIELKEFLRGSIIVRIELPVSLAQELISKVSRGVFSKHGVLLAKEYQSLQKEFSFRDIRVWLVDGIEPLYRIDLQNILESEEGMRCRSAFSHFGEVINELNSTEKNIPDIILADIGTMGEPPWDSTIAHIRSQFPSINIIVLTNYSDDDSIFDAFRAGAGGYILKSSSFEEIVGAVREIHQGGAPMTSQIAKRVLNHFHKRRESRPKYGLTARELEILKEMVEDRTQAQIAERLFITRYTVSSHVMNIYAKLNVNSKVAAVRKAVSERIINDS